MPENCLIIWWRWVVRCNFFHYFICHFIKVEISIVKLQFACMYFGNIQQVTNQVRQLGYLSIHFGKHLRFYRFATLGKHFLQQLSIGF